MITVPSKGITAEERLILKRYNRKISQKSLVGLNMLVQSMGTNTVYRNVISSSCEIGDLKGAWNAIRDKYDSKKPATQSLLAIIFSNCSHMPVETVEQFISRLIFVLIWSMILEKR